MEAADRDVPLPLGWVQAQDAGAKLYISALDKVAVSTSPSGLPEGWVARAHRTLGLVFAHAQSLLDGTGRWTVIDPRGLASTGVVLRPTAAGPLFVDEETGVCSDFDPRWNCQTTPSERRSFVRFDVTMNTGPSARQQLAAKYAELEELLVSGADVPPEAALVFVTAGNGSKVSVASYDRSKAAELAALSFDEETEALLEQLNKHQESIVEPCLTELLERRGPANEGMLPRCDGFAAHLRVRTAGCVARLDCKAAGSLELPLHCVVFGYFRTSEATGALQFRLLAPVRGFVEAKDLFRFERVAKPADISSSPVASVLTSLPSGTARASVIHAFAAHSPADNVPDSAASSSSEAATTTATTTTATTTTTSPTITTQQARQPKLAVHTILDTFSAAWTRFLNGLPAQELPDGAGPDPGGPSPSTVVPAALAGGACETKHQLSARARERWDLLRRRYKVAALRIMRARIEERRSGVQQAAAAYDKRRSNIIEARFCKICWDAEIDVTCIPCGHQCVCQECAQDIRQCPMCCSPIEENRATGFPPSYGQDTVLLSRQPPLCGRHEPGAVRRVVSAAAAGLAHEFAAESIVPSHLRLFYSPTNALEQQLEHAQDVLLAMEPSVLAPSLSVSTSADENP